MLSESQKKMKKRELKMVVGDAANGVVSSTSPVENATSSKNAIQ